MPTIYDHELASYRNQIDNLKTWKPEPDSNLTHEALAYSNRLNLILIGLCSLVEARLFDLARDQPSKIQLDDIKGMGIKRLQTFLGRLEVLDFGSWPSWSLFTHLITLRNAIVHGYGGIILEEQSADVQKSLAQLGFSDGMVADRRIRLRQRHLIRILEIVENVIADIDNSLAAKPPPK